MVTQGTSKRVPEGDGIYLGSVTTTGVLILVGCSHNAIARDLELIRVANVISEDFFIIVEMRR